MLINILGAATILHSLVVQCYNCPVQLLSTPRLSRPTILHPPLYSTATILHCYNCPVLQYYYLHYTPLYIIHHPLHYKAILSTITECDIFCSLRLLNIIIGVQDELHTSPFHIEGQVRLNTRAPANYIPLLSI